jgi:trehalose 6-phosphate synthase/phosphatase
MIEHWFHKHPVDLIACSDAAFRRDGQMDRSPELATAWQADARPILDKYVIRTPDRTSTKTLCLDLAFENADKELGEVRSREFIDDLRSFAGMENLQVNEVGPPHRDPQCRNTQGQHAAQLSSTTTSTTSSSPSATINPTRAMFAMLPPEAITVRIGSTLTSAQYNLPDHARLLAFLGDIASPG